MPRIYASNNDPYDYCKRCFPTEDDAIELFGNVGEGPDDRGSCFSYDTDHPSYDGEEYKCEECKKPLTARDD